METLDKINDLELMEFTSGDIEGANERIVKNTSKVDSKVKLSIWEYILILFHIKALNAIVLDENTINETWERVKLKHTNHEQYKDSTVKKSTTNGIQSYLRKVGV